MNMRPQEQSDEPNLFCKKGVFASGPRPGIRGPVRGLQAAPEAGELRCAVISC